MSLPGCQALIKLTGVRHSQVRLEEAAVSVMLVSGDLDLAPDQEVTHEAGGRRVEVASEDHRPVLPGRVCNREQKVGTFQFRKQVTK